MRLQTDQPPLQDAHRGAISRHWLADEQKLVRRLVADSASNPAEQGRIEARAADWVRRVRAHAHGDSPVDAFMREYDLSSAEGVLLMCLAEALLRIPDDATAEKLIEDTLGGAAWQRHLGHSESLLVNASTWGLMLGGRLLRLASATQDDALGALRGLAARASEPVIRLALRQAMGLMARHFVIGRDIGEAIDRAEAPWRYSFDMLGEAALTADDAARYLSRYDAAIRALAAAPGESLFDRPGISVKLSALHPRFEYRQAGRVMRELAPRLLRLAQSARSANLSLIVDAEEAERLELMLDVFDEVYSHDSLAGWNGLGLAVQAYSRRALPVIDFLRERARKVGRRMPLRLVKGAYWDSEIKLAQVQGLASYPVFTRKAHTDASFLACAKRLLDARDVFYPMLASHNAHSLAAVHALAGDARGYELQRLHGMGEALHEIACADTGLPCRVYAPVGAHHDLLPYLVRRLLENGANSSFVHRLHDAGLEPEALARDPRRGLDEISPGLPPPSALFAPQRENAPGIHLADALARAALESELKEFQTSAAEAPHAPSGDVPDAAIRRALEAQPRWEREGVESRAGILERAAQALIADRAAFLQLLVQEAGKTWPDAVGEWRETIDFLRYYAAQARGLMGAAAQLPGPAGESNQLRWAARGVFTCISPWNFPLAIFTGQVAAALVCGNGVIAKPAEQTPRVALRMTWLLHESGVPQDLLHCLAGDGALGAALVADSRIAGVAFTGSFATAKSIQRALAAREGAMVPLIAETGGQNVMIADSSALPEQLVRDVLASAFGSAGQRCSALRVLYLQEQVFESVTSMLRGAMRELRIGDQQQLSTDVGPVIDAHAQARLLRHVQALREQGAVLEQLELPADCRDGRFVAPCLARIRGIEALEEEHFGPILHLATFRAGELDALVDRINASGFGLTLGVHSRIESTWRRVAARARVGNVYVNRGMTGAVVGSQPFGGEGRSGTGPKAGGPHYLPRFCTERSLCVNTSAVGGDAALLRESGLLPGAGGE